MIGQGGLGGPGGPGGQVVRAVKVFMMARVVQRVPVVLMKEMDKSTIYW